ncbi:MAG: hypothetical protein CMJ78_22360 [Planctomycetaceae bacterium]|nr:hypothetical protein [Planctomycetaceae bacterium]
MEPTTLTYQKVDSDGAVATCTIERLEDGSVYVTGDEFGELIVEFTPDALERAIGHVTDAGYEEG